MEWAIVAIVGLAFAGFIAIWLKQNHDQHTGSQLEAGMVSQETALAEVRMAQAAVNAPRTQDALVASMKNGSF